MTLLNERTVWNAANTDAQQQAITALLAANPTLQNQFEYLGLQQFHCAQISNTVAVFRHLRSDMVLHLVPGEQKFCPGLSAEQAQAVVDQFGMNSLVVESNEVVLYLGYSIRISPFLISRYLVTERVWALANGASLPAYFGADCAADAVHRHHAVAAAAELGLTLPSEMQWEYACKAGSNQIFYWGDAPDLAMALTEDNTDFSRGYRSLTAEEQKPGNAFGLLGMIGNLSEWVADDYNHRNSLSNNGPFAPTQRPYSLGHGPEHSDGVLRGGGYIYNWKYNRSTARIACSPIVDGGVGVRLAFNLNTHLSRAAKR